MGRYAFFNTGFEYKFAFAVQPSEDILKFGGTPKFVYEGDNEHKWSIVDRPRILDRLRDIEITLGLPEFDFNSYEKSLEGTNKLRHQMWDIGVSNQELFATYLLGSILYHQLLYKLDLSCTYES